MNPHRSMGLRILLAMLATAVAPLAAPGAEPEQDLAARANEAVAKLQGVPLDRVWGHTAALRALGSDALPLLAEKAKGLQEAPRLAVAYALCQIEGGAEVGGEEVLSLLSGAAADDVRLAAARSLRFLPEIWDLEKFPKVLRERMTAEKNDRVKVAVADVLWRATSDATALRALNALVGSEDLLAHKEAVLAIADAGRIELIRDDLIELMSEPSLYGLRAIDIVSRERDTGSKLLKEILDNIEQRYPDTEKSADAMKLYTAAAKGMVSSLDPFSGYLDAEDVQDMNEGITGRYGGIGAYVGIRENMFTIITPIYSGPAYRAGLRSMDRIMEVDGDKCAKYLPNEMQKIVAKLKGEPGTKVSVKVYRRGWHKPRDVSITRELIHVESVRSVMLPCNIGFVRLTRFGTDSTDELKREISKLEKDGMKALVFDLRNNPGGLLQSAVDVVDLFVAEGLICYSEGRPETAPRHNFNATGQAPWKDLPLVVLTNSGAASGSEIVAGALQDLHRAKLVGETTYGKGSVQSIIPMRSTGYTTRLRLTIAKYYLPSGRCIHEQGVEPDIPLEQPEPQGWVFDEMDKLRDAGVIQDYVTKIYKPGDEKLAGLVEYDGNDPSAYPGFDELYEQTKAKATLSKNDVRIMVRNALRPRIEDERKAEYVCDLEEDVQLQRAVYELLQSQHFNYVGVRPYEDMAKKFAPKPQEIPAADKTAGEAEKETEVPAAQ